VAEARKLLSGMVRLMSALVQLENYAHLNYEGFGKALKKHDKLTKRSCRLSFMRHWVNAQSFAYSPVLRRFAALVDAPFGDEPPLSEVP
jgi:SPX domain protein involved in polyphosphate accumulation